MAFLGPISGDLATGDADLLIDETERPDLTEANGALEVMADVDGATGGVTRIAVGISPTVGVPEFDDEKGSFYIFEWTGPGEVTLDDATTILHGEEEAWVGIADVSWGGDLDLDGLSELVVPMPSNDDYHGYRTYGGAYVVEPPLSGAFDLANSDAIIVNRDADAADMGDFVLSGWDLDGDFVSDLIIGTYYSQDMESGGRMHFFRGGTGAF